MNKTHVFQKMTILIAFQISGFVWATTTELPNPSDTWPVIRSSSFTKTLEPSVRMQHAYGFIDASLFDVCLGNDLLRLRAEPLVVCSREVRSTKGSPSALCAEYATVFPRSPTSTSEESCAQWSKGGGKNQVCVEKEKIKTNYSQKFNIPVVLRTGTKGNASPSQLGAILFYKTYRIPVCEDEKAKSL